MIWVVPPEPGAITEALGSCPKSLKWVYLGTDMVSLLRVEPTLRGRGERIRTAARLQAIAGDLRQRYIDYVGCLSRRFASVEWWAGELSEKNISISSVFRNACYLKLALEVARQLPDSDLLLVAEDRTLRAALCRELLKAPDTRVTGIGAKRCRADAGSWLIAIAMQVYVGLRFLYFVLATRVTLRGRATQSREKLEGRELTLLCGWADERSIGSDGGYRDVYLGELGLWLRKANETTVYVPFVLSTVPYRAMLKRLLRTGESFLFPFAFLRVRDLIAAAWKGLSFKPKSRQTYPMFAGLCIDDLIAADDAKSWSRARRFYPLLRYYLVRRWYRDGLKIKALYYPFENMRWEKVLCLALREFYPQAVVTGYAHSSFSQMELNHFYSPHEAGLVPSPDQLLLVGDAYFRVFANAGYDPARLRIVGAYRYRYLYSSDAAQKRARRTGAPAVLGTLSREASAASELLRKLLEALGEDRRYSVIVKCHPLMPASRLRPDLARPLPDHFKVSESPVSALWDQVDVLVYTDSTTALEALAMGIPVVQVSSDMLVDMDPLDVCPELRKVASDSMELRRLVEDAVQASRAGRVNAARWRRVVESMLGPVSALTV